MDNQFFLGLGVSVAFTFIRYRWPAIPRPLADAGLMMGLGLVAISFLPSVRLGPAITGTLALALGALAVSWQFHPSKPASPQVAQQARVKSEPTVSAHVAAQSATAPEASLSMVVTRAQTPPAQIAGAGPPNTHGAKVANTETAQPIPDARPYSLSTDDKRQLLDRVLPLKAVLPHMVISRSAVPGGDPIMMQLAEVFMRAGFEVNTGFQQPTGPSQTGLFVCVPDLQHVPPVATKIQEALAEIGFKAPMAQLPPDATQNAVVIFAGPAPL